MPDFHVTVARVQRAQTHPDDDLVHLSVITVLDKPCIAGKLEDGDHRYPEGSLVTFFPVGSIIPLELLKLQGFYWDPEKDRGLLKGGKRNRVGPVTRGSVTSEGLLFPVAFNKEEGIYYIERAKSHDPYNFKFVQEGDHVEEFLGVTEYKG